MLLRQALLRHRAALPWPQLQRAAALSAAAEGGNTPSVALVQGASRGLGLEFVRQLLQRPDSLSVVATCRRPEAAEELQGLAREHGGRLRIVPLDVTSERSIEEAAAAVSESHGHLDLLLNVAGILHVPGEMSPETGIARVEAKNLLRNFQINACGPILVAKAFAPLLVRAAQHSGADKSRPAVVANLSARVGSISDNSLGGWYSYRASKSAQNQLSKTLANEFGRRKQCVAVIMLHPGTVDTDLSLPFQKNVQPEKLFSRERAVRQLLGIIDGVRLGDSGRFLAWDGQDIPF